MPGAKTHGLWGIIDLWVIPANQVGRSQNLWGFIDYGFSERWVMTASTVANEQGSESGLGGKD